MAEPRTSESRPVRGRKGGPARTKSGVRVTGLDTSRIAGHVKRRGRQVGGHIGFVMKRMFLGLRSATLEQFYFQLSTMLSAGVTIREALFTLAGQYRGRAKRYVSEAAEEVQASGVLSDALRRRPWVYGPFAITMVETSEQTGRLDDNLRVVADTMEKFRRVKTRLITGLIYPVLLLHAAVFIPKLVVLVKSGWWEFFVRTIPTLMIIYGAVAVLWFLYQIVRETRVFGEFLCGMFLFGKVSKKIAYSRISRALAALYEAGVPVAHAVRVSIGTAANAAIRQDLYEATADLHSGVSLSEAMSRARHASPLVRNMMATGEHSGSLSTSLVKVAEFYEYEAVTAVDRVMRVLPVLIYLAIAGYIGSRIVAFYVNRYGLG